MEKRDAQSQRPSRSRSARYSLSALLFCGECGRRLQAKVMRPARTLQWFCFWAKTIHPEVSVQVSDRLATRHVRAVINDLVRGREAAMNAAAEREFYRAASVATDQDVRGSLEREFDRFSRKLSRLYDMRTDDEIGEDDYREKRAEYIAEQTRIKAELDSLRPPAPIEVPDFEALTDLDSVWDQLPTQVLRDAIGALFPRIVVSRRTESSSNASASDRIECVGAWDVARLEEVSQLA